MSIEEMNRKEIYNLNTTNLAYIGDSVYDVFVRERLMELFPKANTNKLQKDSVKYVSAKAQAKIIKSMFDELTEEEQKLVKRARNRKSATKPKNADPVDYKWATAFEALVGYLHLSDEEKRLNEVVEKALGIAENNL